MRPPMTGAFRRQKYMTAVSIGRAVFDSGQSLPVYPGTPTPDISLRRTN